MEYRARAKEARTEKQMIELSEELKELKERGNLVPTNFENSEMSARTIKLYEGKISELRAALEVSKEKLHELEATHEEQINKILQEHKGQLIEYANVVQNQATEIKKCNAVIDDFKEELTVIKEEKEMLTNEVVNLKDENTRLKMLSESQEKLIEYLRSAINNKTPIDVDDVLIQNVVMTSGKSRPKDSLEKFDELEPENKKQDNQSQQLLAGLMENTPTVEEIKGSTAEIGRQNKDDENLPKSDSKHERLSQNYIKKSALLRNEIQMLDGELQNLHMSLNNAIAKKKEELARINKQS